MSNPAKIIAILTALPGKANELHSLLAGMAPQCRAEPGNLRWDIWKDQAESGRFVLDELYRDEDAVVAHRETTHYKNYLSRIGDLAARTAIMLSPSDVAITSPETSEAK
jgi:quinol monooxygenase YgiN